MRCDMVIETLSPFLDEMLEEDLTALVAHHLNRCSSCSR